MVTTGALGSTRFANWAPTWSVADRPEGPYLHREVVLEGFGDPQPERWDAVNAHNPCVTRMLDPQVGRERYLAEMINKE